MTSMPMGRDSSAGAKAPWWMGMGGLAGSWHPSQKKAEGTFSQ